VTRESSMDQTKIWRKQLLSALLAPLLVGLGACGGGGDEDQPREIPGLVTIESPGDSRPTCAETVTVSGSRSATAPSVTWSNSAGGSGTAALTGEECFIAGFRLPCNTGFNMSVPLAVGTNTITVTATNPGGDFGRDTITLTRVAC
jgi:hypothetical protein